MGVSDIGGLLIGIGAHGCVVAFGLCSSYRIGKRDKRVNGGATG